MGKTHRSQDLSGNDFNGRTINGETFIACNLSNANFDGCELIGCHFLGCKMDDTKFDVIINDNLHDGFRQTLFCGSNLEDSTFDTSKHLQSSHTESRNYIGDYSEQVKQYGFVYHTVATKEQRTQQEQSTYIRTSATDPMVMGLRTDGKRIEDVHLVCHQDNFAFYYKGYVYDPYENWGMPYDGKPSEKTRWYDIENLNVVSRKTRTDIGHIGSYILLFASRMGLTYIFDQLKPDEMILDTMMMKAIKYNNMVSVMALTDRMPIQDRHIIRAARKGRLEILKYLVEIYGNNKAVMSTAMREAGKNGHRETFEFLVSMGGDTDCDWYINSVQDELKERFL